MLAATRTGGASSDSTWPDYQPQVFRWNEDYSAICQLRPPDLPHQLKCLKLDADGDRYASFGGEYRLKIDDFSQPDFGLHGAPSFLSSQQRYLAHMDLHLNAVARVFLQIGGGDESGRKPIARPGDKGDVDIAQLFVDFNMGVSSQPWRLRVGRQEVELGRYITTREVTNLRRTFDGARLDAEFGGWTLTALAADATRNRVGAFNDDSNPHDRIVALLLTDPVNVPSGLKLDLAILQHESDAATYAAGLGRERRATVGARVYGGDGPWDIDAASTYQFGNFAPNGRAALDIAAWGMAFEGGWTLKGAPLSPRIAVRADLASGTEAGNTHSLGTFDLPYPNLAYLSDAAIFSPRNIRDIQPFITVVPVRPLSVTLGSEFLWRFSKADAVYSFANLPLVPAGGDGSYVATQAYVRMDWHVTRLIDLRSSVVVAIPGELLSTAAGANRKLTFGTIAVDCKF
jgi:hypothetical protein